MADILGLDPARIERLRDPARYDRVDPARIWEVLERPRGGGTLADVGAGVGFAALRLAATLPDTRVIACDVLPQMLELLAADALEQGLANVECRPMSSPVCLPLADGEADVLVMVQVHHELDDAPGLLADCARVLAGGGKLAIVDWKDEPLDGVPPAGRRVACATIMAQCEAAGFIAVTAHDLYSHHSFVAATVP